MVSTSKRQYTYQSTRSLQKATSAHNSIVTAPHIKPVYNSSTAHTFRVSNVHTLFFQTNHIRSFQPFPHQLTHFSPFNSPTPASTTAQVVPPTSTPRPPSNSTHDSPSLHIPGLELLLPIHCLRTEPRRHIQLLHQILPERPHNSRRDYDPQSTTTHTNISTISSQIPNKPGAGNDTQVKKVRTHSE